MNTSEFVKSVSEETGINKKVVKQVVDAFLRQIGDELVAGNECRLNNLFTVFVRDRKARRGKNMWTGEDIEIPFRRTVAVRGTKHLKSGLNPDAESK